MSIFSKLKEQNDYDGSSGKKELRHIYIENDLSAKAQLSEADFLVNQIIDYYKSYEEGKQLYLAEAELIRFYGIFIAKINAAVKEGCIREKWLESLTEKLVFESDDPFLVKVGLVLSEKYMGITKLKAAIDVFSHSGEYVFYTARAVKRLSGYNKFLLNLAKASQGTIRIYAVSNIEYFSTDTVKYLMEEGYKDVYYETLLINYILVTVNLEQYLETIEDDARSINDMSYLIYKHLRNFDFKKSPIRSFIIRRFIPVVQEKGSDLYSLLAILLVGQSLSEESGMAVHEGMYWKIVEPLKDEKWTNIFRDTLKNGEADSVDILEMATFYNYKLNTEELRRLYEANSLDFYLYWYVNNKENNEVRIEFMKKFLCLVDINTLLDREGRRRDSEFDNGLEDVIFAMILNGCAKIYPEGKELALKGIFGRSKEVRKEAVNVLKLNRTNLTKEEVEVISEAASKEKNYELKNLLSRLIYSNDEVRNEYIGDAEMKKRKLQRHAKDIYLLSTTVAGFRYRDIGKIKEELEKSNVFFLVEEPENPYDKNAIRIVSDCGYVIGYIPRKDNEVLHNLLVKNMHLYCVVREYSLEDDRIPIDVYFSYKNILDEAGQLFRVITSKENGFYEN